MIVADTSVWIELLRGSGHPTARALRGAIARGADIAVTEVILMEMLGGTRSGEPTMQLRSRLLAFPIIRLEGIADYEEAAAIYRRCRDAGHTLRSLLDCLIAVAAIRHDASLLHNDRDFETIARHTTLKLEPVHERPEMRETARSYGHPRRARTTASGGHRARSGVRRSAARV